MNKLEKGLEVIKKINTAGYSAYIVGGAVRDYLLNKDIIDVDITTNATVEVISTLFETIKLDAVKYAGITILYLEEEFEITSFRRDISYKDHRHPIVEFVENIDDDLIRRDFTMNALIMDLNGNIIDSFNGKQSINEKIIHCIGNPKIRFDEDGLRVLRAVYFCGKLGFELDEEIKDSISLVDYVAYLPKEYIKTMLEKILELSNRNGLKYIVEYNILRGFPFYQVLADECYKYNVSNRDKYALFYSLHNFLPENERITKEEYKYACSIGNLIRNQFSPISLYDSKGLYLEYAQELFEKIYHKVDVIKKYNDLVIHSVSDVDFDFSLLNGKSRSKLQRMIIEAVLNKEVENSFDSIVKFLKLRRQL